MKDRRLSEVHLLRRDSDTSLLSTESDTKEPFNGQLLQPAILEEQEEEEEERLVTQLNKPAHVHSYDDHVGGLDYKQISYIENGTDSSDQHLIQCTGLRCMKMLAACLTFVPVGMATTILGATLLEVQTQTGTSSANMALMFTWRGLGAVGGNLFVGVMFQKTRPEALLCTGVVGLALTQSALPICQSYGYLVAVVVGSGISIGILGTGLNAYVVDLWKTRSAPFTQALHLSVSCGSMLGPLICVPFLDSTSTQNTKHHHVDQYSSANNYTLVEQNKVSNKLSETAAIIANDEGEMGIALNDVLHQEKPFNKLAGNQSVPVNYTDPVFVDGEEENVLIYPYAIISLLCGLASLLYLYILLCKHQKKVEVPKMDAKPPEKFCLHSNAVVQAVILVLLNLICVLLGSLEGAFGGYIAVYAVNRLQMTSSMAAVLATTFWACFALGRGLSIFIVQCFKSHVMIIADWLIVTLSLFVFFMFHQSHVAVAFVSCSLIGLALSSIFGNVLSYTNTNLAISAKVTASYVINFYIGMMACQSVLGFLMAIYGPDVMLYFLFSVALCALITFCFVHFILMKRFIIK